PPPPQLNIDFNSCVTHMTLCAKQSCERKLAVRATALPRLQSHDCSFSDVPHNPNLARLLGAPQHRVATRWFGTDIPTNHRIAMRCSRIF
ncbi:MAG: hypothetical protein FWD61_17715, partial [Phycisphaerales bacterium]|nr:hypothetical protein [Phycisphaerales bacterium]